jgi:hypothetical protein
MYPITPALRRIAAALTVMVLAFAPARAFAQISAPTTASAEEKRAARLFNEAVKRTLNEAAMAEPLGDSTQPSAHHQITVLADKGDVNGRARFYIPAGPSDFIVTLTGPLSGGSTTLFSNTGLGKQVTLNTAIKLTHAFGAAVGTTAPVPGAAAAVSAATDQQFLATLGAFESKRASISTGRATALDTAAISNADSVAGLNRMAVLADNPKAAYALAAQTNPSRVKSQTFALTPGLEIQRHAIDYLDSTSLASNTADHTTVMFTAAGGITHLRKRDEQVSPDRYVGASFKAGSTVKVDDPRHICRPLASGASECLDAPVGAPVTGTLQAYTVEWRQWLYGQSLGLNPRYSYSRTSPDSGATRWVHTIDMPVYFIRQAKDLDAADIELGPDLIGGVNVGWRNSSGQHGVFLALFVTKAFGIQ